MSKITEIFGSMVFDETVMKQTAAGRLRQTGKTYRGRERASDRGSERHSVSGQRLGGAEGRYAFHALVPADDRSHR